MGFSGTYDPGVMHQRYFGSKPALTCDTVTGAMAFGHLRVSQGPQRQDHASVRKVDAWDRAARPQPQACGPRLASLELRQPLPKVRATAVSNVVS